MYKSPSHLPEESRQKVCAALGAVLVDGLDLQGQLKVAHWNVKGPYFAALHPLFESFAGSLAGFNDAIAERSVTLGDLVSGTARHVAAHSRIAEYPPSTARDLDHVRLLAERFGVYLAGVREARFVAESLADTDTVDLLTGVISGFEKHGWFLRASLDT